MGNKRTQIRQRENTKQINYASKTVESEKQPNRLDETSLPLMGGAFHPGMSPVSQSITFLQRMIGNQAAGRLIEASWGTRQPGDKHEHGADLATSVLVNTSDAVVEPQEEEEKEELAQTQISAPIQMQKEEEEEPQIAKSSSEPQGVSPHGRAAATLPTSMQGQTQWSNHVETEDIDHRDSAWGTRPTASSDSDESPCWAASAASQVIAQPRPVSWANQELAGVKDRGMINEAIVGPAIKPLTFIQPLAPAARPLGATSRPSKFKVPNFKFGTINMASVGVLKALAKKPLWYAFPKLTATAYEGDNFCYYISSGLHKTIYKEGGKPVYWRMSNAMSKLDHDAELEHSNDHKHAYKISLKEAEDVLTKHVVGKSFGPKPTKAAAEQMVLDTIRSKLTHPKLGNDKTKWGAQYKMLSGKTGIRDKKGWHAFGLGNRKEVKNKAGVVTKIIYKVNKGTTKINVVKSKTLVKY